MCEDLSFRFAVEEAVGDVGFGSAVAVVVAVAGFSIAAAAAAAAATGETCEWPSVEESVEASVVATAEASAEAFVGSFVEAHAEASVVAAAVAAAAAVGLLSLAGSNLRSSTLGSRRTAICPRSGRTHTSQTLLQQV